MKSPGPTRLAPASSRYRYAPRKTTTNTSAVCVCIPASNPGRNFVNPPNGPLTVSPQATELETPGTSGEYDDAAMSFPSHEAPSLRNVTVGSIRNTSGFPGEQLPIFRTATVHS